MTVLKAGTAYNDLKDWKLTHVATLRKTNKTMNN